MSGVTPLLKHLTSVLYLIGADAMQCCMNVPGPQTRLFNAFLCIAQLCFHLILINLLPLTLQDLWGIFLSHLMEVLHSGNTAVRAAAIDALDRSLTGAIASPLLGQQQQEQLDTSEQQGQSQQHQHQHQQQPDGSTSGSTEGGSGGGSAGDVEHMLLVALESMYKEEREPDVRLGLLRVALHVLQRHGESLSRWVAAKHWMSQLCCP